jgi:hypothetical protein
MTTGKSRNELNGTAQFLLPNCKMLRVGAGKRVNDLVRASEVSRDTIRKIGKNQPVTEPVIHAVFNALNEWHRSRLDRGKEITKK